MTRKALRKRLQQQTPRSQPRHSRQQAHAWMAVGAIVASTTLAARPAESADLFNPFARKHPFDQSRRYFPPLDGRLALVEEALRSGPPAGPWRLLAPKNDHAGDRQQSTVTRRIDIVPGPLSDVVRAFEQMTGVRVVLTPPSLGTVQSPGVAGVLNPSQALTAILRGTGVRFRFTSATEAVLELDVQAESVEVAGRTPGAAINSPKYPTPLRDTPQTIEVIPRAAMEQQGVTTLTEALRNVPGITLQAGEGGGASSTAGDMFNMRGFNAANSLFVDGVRDDGLISRDVFNLEQVEVFMGPTGSDVGRGTAAGYVNMQTKTPGLPAAAAGSVMYGSGDQRRVSADVNHAIGDAQGGWWSRSAVRANVLWQESGIPGRDVAELGTRAFAPSVGLGLETATRVTVGAQIVRQDNVPDYGLPAAAWPDEPLTPTTVRAASPVDQNNYYGSPDYDFDHASQNSVVARVEHDLTPRATVRNQTRYNRTEREAVITAIAGGGSFNPATNLVTLSRQGNERENEILSNQTSLTSRFNTGRLQHAASAGLELTSEELFAPTLAGVGTRAPVDIFNPNPNDPVVGFNLARNGAFTKGRTSTAALYVFDSVDLTRRVLITGGLRWERYDTDYRAVDASGVETTNTSAADHLFSGKAGLVFRVTDRGSLYLSYGTTLTPPGAANFNLSTQPTNQNNPSVKPQESTNIELGSKWEAAGGRLLLTGAVFHTKNRNVIYVADPLAVPPIYNQDDGQRVKGVTLGANGRMSSRWNVLANVSYLDTALETQNVANDGRQLTLTPEWSGGLWTSYQLPLRITVGGGLRLTDAVFINTANTIRKPGYSLVDLLAEYAVTPHATLRLNVYNATNERYIRSLNNNGGRYNPGQPRAAVVSLALGF